MRKNAKDGERQRRIIYLARCARQTQARASGADILGCISIKVGKPCASVQVRQQPTSERRDKDEASSRERVNIRNRRLTLFDRGKFSSVLRQQSPILRLSFRPSTRVRSSCFAWTRTAALARDKAK